MDCKLMESSFEEHNLKLPKTGKVIFRFINNNNEVVRLFITKLEDNYNFLEENQPTTSNQLVVFFNAYSISF
jgi:hypothetical protein